MINEFRPMNHLTSLQNLICTIGNLPTSYALSLSYEEQIWWLCDFLEKNVFPAIEENTNITEETQQAFIELQNYVRDYFNNLDVQDEINNKLDEMAESGILQEIISSYLNSKALFGFDTISDIKKATNLINGSYARTLGYYYKNDGGGALYKIRNITNNDIVNEMSIIALNNNNLIAELIIENCVNVKQCGCYGDGLHNDSSKIQSIFNTFLPLNRKIYFPNGVYLINTSIDVPVVNYSYIKLDNEATLKAVNNINEIFRITTNASHFIIEGGILDCDSKANYGINSIYSTNKYAPIYKNIFFKDSLLSGFISRDPSHSGGSEHGFILNCKFYNQNTLSECITLYAGDYVIDNCEMFYTNLGVRCSTILTISNSHIWAGGNKNPNTNTIGIRFTGPMLLANNMYFDGMNHCFDTFSTSPSINASNILDYIPGEASIDNPVVFKTSKYSRISCNNLNIHGYSSRIYKVNLYEMDTKNLNNQNFNITNVIETYDNHAIYDYNKVDYGNNIFINNKNMQAITKGYNNTLENNKYYKIGYVILKNGSVTGANLVFSSDDLNKYNQEVFFTLYLTNGTVNVQSNVSKYLGEEVGRIGIAIGKMETISTIDDVTIYVCPIYLHMVNNPGNMFGISVSPKISNVGNWVEFFPYDKFISTPVENPSLLFDDITNT